MNEAFEVTRGVLAFLASYGLAIAGILLFLKAAGLPLPIPGDVMLIGVGILCSQGLVPLGAALVYLSLATLGGACVLFFGVRQVGRPGVDRYGRYVGLTDARLSSVSTRLEDGGWWAVVVGRLTPGLRMATTVAAGLFRLPSGHFTSAAGVSAVLEVGVCLLVGLLLGPILSSLFST